MGTAAALVFAAAPATAQDGGTHLPPVVVSATRSAETIATIPGSVTVIERTEIERQQQVSKNLADMLGKLVPGFAPGSQTQTISGQTLRGRNVLVLIDGVPQTTTRNAMRDLNTIAPGAVERVEVIRGATAIYGSGASGGVINIITRKPEGDDIQFTTEVGGRASLSHPSIDGLGGRLEQTVSGRSGNFSFLGNLSLEQTGNFFDAKGDRIPPDPSQGDLSDTRTINLMGKAGIDRDDHHLSLTVNHFRARQDTNYASDPAVNAFPAGSVKARAVNGLVLDDQPMSRNSLVNLDYTNDDLFGSVLHAQAYYRNYLTRFYPYDGRALAAWNNIAQTELRSESAGGRLAVETPVSLLDRNDLTVLWGADYAHEVTEQPAILYDPATFDRSGGLVFQRTDKRTFVPPITHDSVGLFAQLEWAANDWLTLRAGARHEFIRAEVGDFVTLGQRNPIRGGSVNYGDTVYNLGATAQATDAINVFANFSQGFSLPDLGLGLRGAPRGFTIAAADLKPVKVNNYEVGVRGDWNTVQASLSTFYSTSDLGVTSGGFTTTMIRAPERVYGVEGTLDLQLARQWAVGGTFTWTEGENDPNDDGDYTPLNSWRIPPLKVTSYVEYKPTETWSNRLQLLYSGGRDRAYDAGVGYGGQKIDSYATLDLISAAAVGPGILQVGIENLLNTQYHTTFAQLLPSGTNTSHIAAQGTVISVAYKVTW